MPRLSPVDSAHASPEQSQILTTVRQAMGGVPNLVATLAHSPAAARAYLALNQALSQGSLTPKVREQIALAVSEVNGCLYCLSAHGVLGRKAGLTDDEVKAARRGTAPDARSGAVARFVQRLVATRGRVADAELSELRKHGWTDGDIAEMVAHTALNIFTNTFNHVADTAIDFPVAPPLAASASAA